MPTTACRKGTSMPAQHITRRTVAVCVGLLAMLVGCAGTAAPATSSTSPATIGPAATPPVDTATTIVVDITTAATTIATTTVPTTVAALPTTTVPVAIVLRGNGIGVANFGDADTTVLTALTPLLGAPVTVASPTFPVSTDPSRWMSADDQTSFVAPFGRQVCYLDRFCLYFGGDTATAVRLVGWSYSPEATPSAANALRTVEGMTIDDSLDRFPGAVVIPTGGCYSNSNAPSSDGVNVGLQSTGEPFISYPPEGGNEIIGHPAPADLLVTSLDAGSLIYDVNIDC
jgi:hypothetical protein